MKSYDDHIAIDEDTVREQMAELEAMATECYQRNFSIDFALVPRRGSTGFNYFRPAIGHDWYEIEVYCDGASLGIFRSVHDAEEFLVSIFGELS